MIDDVERLDAALNLHGIGATLDDVPPPLRALADLALEIGDTYATWKLSAAERDRLYTETLQHLDAALRAHRHVWQRLPVGRRGAVIGGAAAATVVAVIGVGVILDRRGGHAHRLPDVA